MKTLIVLDQFVSFQGTGINSGVKQSFLRLAGCTVKCPLRNNCDQPEALSRGDGHEMSIESILGNVIEHHQSRWLHITGGEPAEHEHMVALCDAAHQWGIKVQVQTSGTIPIDWHSMPFVSVSPKQERLQVVPSEIVLIAAAWLTDEFALATTAGWDCPVFVVPEATEGQFVSSRMLDLVDTLHRHDVDARPGLQSHLVWGIE